MVVCGIRTLGNRIEAPGVERMTATKAAQRQPAAAYGTKSFDGLEGIIRAAGVEAALIADERAQHHLITTDQSAGDQFRYTRDCHRQFLFPDFMRPVYHLKPETLQKPGLYRGLP